MSDYDFFKKPEAKPIEQPKAAEPTIIEKKVIKKITIKNRLDRYFWDVFEEMHLRLHNQLDSKAKPNTNTDKFLGKIDELKKHFEEVEV